MAHPRRVRKGQVPPCRLINRCKQLFLATAASPSNRVNKWRVPALVTASRWEETCWRQAQPFRTQLLLVFRSQTNTGHLHRVPEPSGQLKGHRGRGTPPSEQCPTAAESPGRPAATSDPDFTKVPQSVAHDSPWQIDSGCLRKRRTKESNREEKGRGREGRGKEGAAQRRASPPRKPALTSSRWPPRWGSFATSSS